jgi:hypothetical protein
MSPGQSRPLLAVLETKFIRGVNNLTEEPDQYLDLLPFEDALNEAYLTDAHFVPYAAVGPDGSIEVEMPRCNKPVLKDIRDAGGDIVMTALVLDYDNPDHQPWTRAMYKHFMELLSEVGETFSTVWEFTYFYTTKHGGRFIYVLEDPVPVDVGEEHLRWLIEEFCKHGIEVDRACGDWTRVYRLPFVKRNGVGTWDDEIFEIIDDPDRRLNTEHLGRIESTFKQQYGMVRHIDEEMPDLDDAQDLLTKEGSRGRRIQSDMAKKAKRLLKGRDCFPCLFEHKELAAEGSRNNTLHHYVGQVVSLLFGQGITMEDIFALFLEPVLQLEPDRGTPDWTAVLWDQIQRCWAKEEASVAARQMEEEEREEDKRSKIERIRDGMREWCNAPDLHNTNDHVSMGFAVRHLIANCKGDYFIMKNDGYYEAAPFMHHQIIGQLRHMGLDDLIETTRVGRDGNVHTLPASEIISNHCCFISKIVAEPEIDGAYVTDIQVPSAATLYQCSYRRNPNLKSLFNPSVDEWLRHLGGNEEGYNALCRWIAWALAFEEGATCALSIMGAPGAGKKMLIEGLSECLETPALADTDDLTSGNQYGLLESPFLSVNEGWPRLGQGLHPADQFRKLVSGDSFKVNRKYMAPVDVTNPVRIIFTANNLDVIHMLTANRNMSPEDREALSIRILHMDIKDKSSKWLSERGGMQYTGAPGQRWIRGDGGEPSDFIVARHFLWLYEKRHEYGRDSRLLVEGNGEEKLIFDMRTQSGHTPIVIEAIIQMLNSPNTPDGLVLQDGRLWATGAEVLKYYRKNMTDTGERLTGRGLQEVFRGLVVQEPEGPTILSHRKSMGELVWYELDVAVLLAAAQKGGWSCPKLQKVVDSREGANV